MEFYIWFTTFIVDMTNHNNTIKSKRLKVIRILMYLDALLLVLSVALLDFRDLSFAANTVSYNRIFILLLVFGILYVTEKNICRYLRKHRNDLD